MPPAPIPGVIAKMTFRCISDKLPTKVMLCFLRFTPNERVCHAVFSRRTINADLLPIEYFY
jgi:hypothetical protein